MVENYIEELVEEWLILKGYMTRRRVPFWKPRGSTRKQGQWGDMDVVALKGDEALLVECKEFLGTKRVKEWPNFLSGHFGEAEKIFQKKRKKTRGPPAPDLSGKKIKRLLIANHPESLKSYQKALKQERIEVMPFKEILKEILQHLEKLTSLEEKKVGKYSGMLRLLIELMKRQMLKTSSYK